MSLIDDLLSRFRAQLASQIITAIVGALLIIGLARLLDPSGYGIFFLALSIFSIFDLISRLGIGRSAGRYIAEYKETDRAQIPHIVRTSLQINIVLILIAALVLVLSHRYIAAIFDEPDLTPLLLTGVLLVSLGTTVTFLTKILQGFEAISFIAALEVIGRISRLILALGLVLAGFGAIGALWGYILSSLLMSVLGFSYLIRRIQSIQDRSAQIEPGLRRRIAEYAVPITATNTAKFLEKGVDTILVGYFLSPIAVSYYVVSHQVVTFIETPMSALGFTLSPTFGAQKAAGNIDEISRIYEKILVNALLLYIPAGAGIVLVAEPMIDLIFGSGYSGAVPVLQVLSLYVVFKAVTKITDNGLDYLGRARERAIAKGVTSVLNVLLNIALIPTIGVVGAAIATVFTYGLYTGVNIYIAAQEFTLRKRYILRNLSQILVITGTMSVVVFVLTGYISGLMTLALVVCVGGLTWVVLSIVTGMIKVRQVKSILT